LNSALTMALRTEERWQLFLFGGIASCSAETATIPVDVIKVRLQLQGELGAARQYNGVLDGAMHIFRAEGISGFYKGLAPALLRQATYGSIRFGLFEPLKDMVRTGKEGEIGGAPLPLWKKVVAGAGSGAISSAVCTPTDVIKVRMMADSAGTRYKGIKEAYLSIAESEGIRGLYAGVSPTVQRATLVAAAELASYDEIKQRIIKSGLMGDDLSTHFTASFAAGFIATIVSSPSDVIKSRVMNQPVGPDGRGLTYSSTWDCLTKSIKSEGVTSLWAGFWPNFCRLGPHTIVCFVVIEQCRSVWSGYIRKDSLGR